MRHTFETHSNEPNFKFSCCSCSQTFTKYSSITSHISRKHKGEGQSNSDLVQDDPFAEDVQPVNTHMEESSMDSPQQTCPSSDHVSNLHKSAALFLLTLKEKHKLTQTAVNFAISQVRCMVNYALEDLKDNLQLPSSNLSYYIDPLH